ncbi:MAG: ComE operon protein 1 [Syntrophomonadaceae bacterium]|nr:ComE operon protein 1 [Bacillota bacterium]MBT9146970.1 ComE operon protein 1 [Bacillota bacterium]
MMAFSQSQKFLIIFLALVVLSGGGVLGYRISQEYPEFVPAPEMERPVVEEPTRPPRPLVVTPKVPIERLGDRERERLRLALKININTASVEELQKLPFIGPKRAEKIATGRPYRTIEEITKVHGIGPKTLEKIRKYITVEGAGLEDYVAQEKRSEKK